MHTNINQYTFSADGKRAIHYNGWGMNWEVCTLEYGEMNGATNIILIRHHGSNTEARVRKWLEDGKEIELMT